MPIFNSVGSYTLVKPSSITVMNRNGDIIIVDVIAIPKDVLKGNPTQEEIANDDWYPIAYSGESVEGSLAYENKVLKEELERRLAYPEIKPISVPLGDLADSIFKNPNRMKKEWLDGDEDSRVS